MATTTTTPEEPQPAPDLNNVGIFVTSLPFGYVEPSAAVLAQIQTRLLGRATPPTREFLQDLLTLKVLMPQESRELRIYTLPEAITIVRKMRQVAIRHYHQHTND